MPKSVSKTKRSAKGRHTKTRRSVKPRAGAEQIGATAGRLAENVVTEVARPILRSTDIPVGYVEDVNRSGLFDMAFRITGGALALSSILLAAPIMLILQGVITGRERQAERNDLKSREYRDESGRTHHHTRTFMRDHPGELPALAA